MQQLVGRQPAGTLLCLHMQVPTDALTARQAWRLRWHCTTSPALAEPPSNAALCSIVPRLATSIREAVSDPVVLEHLIDHIAQLLDEAMGPLLTPARISLRQPRPPGVPVEVRRWHLAPCTRSEMLGSPDRSLHFSMRAEGAQSSQAVLSPQNTCRAPLCKPTPKQGSPYKPRMSSSLGRCINPSWPSPA